MFCAILQIVEGRLIVKIRQLQLADIRPLVSNSSSVSWLTSH